MGVFSKAKENLKKIEKEARDITSGNGSLRISNSKDMIHSKVREVFATKEIRIASKVPGAYFRCGWWHLKVLFYAQNPPENYSPKLEISIGDQSLVAAGLYDPSSHEVDFGELTFSIFQGAIPKTLYLKAANGRDTFSFKHDVHTAQQDIPNECFLVNDQPQTQLQQNTFTWIVPHNPRESSSNSQGQDREFKITSRYEFIAHPNLGNRNVTDAFLQVMEDTNVPKKEQRLCVAQEFKQRFPQGDRYLYLLVPGLFTRHYPLYFNENKKWFEEVLKYQVIVANISTDVSVDENAAALRKIILEELPKDKKVILIGHSKGGVDISLCVTKYYPELKDRVLGVIAMQAPLYGTPVVDWVKKHKMLQEVADKVITKIWGGDTRALSDCSYEARAAVLAQYPYDGRLIPTVCFACYNNFGRSKMSLNEIAGIASMDLTSSATVKETGHQCDGLVVQHDARFPGADIILIGDAFHTQPALHFQGNKYHCGALMQALVEMLFRKIAEEQPYLF